MEITSLRPEKSLEIPISAGKFLWMFAPHLVHLIQTRINFSCPRAPLEFTQNKLLVPPPKFTSAPPVALCWRRSWNLPWYKSMEWNTEENCKYGIWKNRLPFHTMPCYSFIHRHLLFAVALCGNINPTYLTKLQRLQNKAVRIITNSELRALINPCLFKSVIIKVLELYKLEIAKLMHQRHKQNLPVASQKFSYHFPLSWAFNQIKIRK